MRQGNEVSAELKATEAFRMLESELPNTRLRGARLLSTSLSHNEIGQFRPSIEQFLLAEDDLFVRTALLDLLSSFGNYRTTNGLRISPQQSVLASHSAGDERVSDIAAAEIARMVKHELSPLIGLLEMAAAREINGYPSSDTQSKLSHLRRRVEGIAKLSVLNEEPEYNDFDLSKIIREEICAAIESYSNVPTHLFDAQLPSELLMFGPQAWIEIVVANSLRNAIEAVPKSERSLPNGIQIVAAEKEGLAVINIAGVGEPVRTDFRTQYQRGASTKGGGRQGTGLVLVSRIAERLGATWTLKPITDGSGSVFEFVMKYSRV